MKIAISGSNGYIASKLIAELEAKNNTVVRLGRDFLSNIERLEHAISGTDAVIHLAGAPIFSRWTRQNKRVILNSRVESTKNIVEAINNLSANNQPKLFISASAIGIYAADQLHTEAKNKFADNFVSGVVKSWEQASENLDPKVRRVVFRIGLILGREAKTIKNLLPLFKLGLGGKIGTGKQPFPFVHIDDVVNAFLWAEQNPHSQGIYNLVAPENIDNKIFTYALAKALRRPALFTVPAFVLKIALGETSTLLLNNPQVYPERLLSEGFRFSFPNIQSCIGQIVQKKVW